MEYLPFGETLVDEHINSFNSPFKFNGKEFDEETGNYYYGARYYDPKLSIFIGVDPLADKYPGISPYAYCLNNPVGMIDPDGMQTLPAGNDDIYTKVISKKGDAHYTQRQIKMTMTMSIVNPNNDDLSNTMFNKDSGIVTLSSFSGAAQKHYAGQDIYTNDNVSVSVIYKVVKSLNDVGKNDHVMMVVGNIPKQNESSGEPVGLAEQGGRVGAVERGTLKNGLFDNVVKHEIGHELGLDHVSGGLMDENSINNTSVNPSERGNIVRNILEPNLGEGLYKESARGSHYSTPIKSQANSF